MDCICSDIANLSAHLHRLPTPPPYLRQMRLLPGRDAGIRCWMWLPPSRGAAAGWQMVLPDCAARKNLPLRRRDCCSAGDRGTEEDAAAKKSLRRERHREDERRQHREDARCQHREEAKHCHREDARSHHREAARHHREDAR